MSNANRLSCAVKDTSSFGGNMETMGYWWIVLRWHWRFHIPGHAKGQVGAVWWYVALVLLVQMLCVTEIWAQGGAPERRTALVIGNSAYRQSPLVNPVNDAQAMAATLGSLGFAVTKIENASKGQMADAIRKFGDTIKLGGVGLFYFAGHGVQVNGENFFIPVDDDIQDKSQVATKGVEVKLVLQAMNNAKNRLNVVILDACRNNPFAQNASRALVPTGNPDDRTRSDSAGGLAPMEALVDTLVAFATAPESVAADGKGKNGVYTENLLRNITEPGLKIEDVFKRTRFAVRQETNGRQVPWENSSLQGDFYFAAAAGSAVTSGSVGQSTTSGRDQQASLQTNRSETAPAKPRSASGFSFSREEEKDRTTRFGKDDEIRARLQAPCPDALRQRPIVIDITEESRAEGLLFTERSSRFAELVNLNLQQAGLTTSMAGPQGPPAAARSGAKAGRAPYPKGSYTVQGVVFSEQGANRIIRLNEASLNAEVALRDPAGRIITMVEVSGERFAGQNTSAATRALTKEQAHDAASQLYAAFCGARY